jgi:hypothetical protein
MAMFKAKLLSSYNGVNTLGLGKKKKKSAEMPPPPGMPLPPMPPPPGMPLPPMPAPAGPTSATPTPIPASTNPLPPMPEPAQPEPVQSAPADAGSSEPVSSDDQGQSESGYSGLYAKKSGKPLKQVYGHIDRISQGEIGSLLDRYSDRFGHELDRDIIIMRKEERDEKMSDVRDSPTVQLLNQEEEEDSPLDGDTLVELHSQLGVIESELRRLKPDYQAAKSEGDREVLRELKPILEELMSERKLLKGIISGDIDISALSDGGENVDDEDVDEDIFLTFVEIVDNLLGSNLPEEAINEFTESEGFEVYKAVGSDPGSADDELRSEFFNVVDSLLGGMPEDAVSEFVESPEFEIYRTIGGMYS